MCDGLETKAAMGVKLETLKSRNSTYLNAVKKIDAIIVRRTISPWFFNDHIFRLSSLGRLYFKEVTRMKKFVHQVIQKRRNYLMNKIDTDSKDDDVDVEGRKQAKPFLDYILLDSNFTNEDIEDEVRTFIFAGHHTTATTISFCIYALSKHSDVQEKMYDEIRCHLDENKRELTYQDYNELKYVENVIKETLRMYTTATAISRKISEDITLPSGYTLPAGSLANLILFRLHNDEKNFANPQQFLPERFEKREDIKNFTFIPFSAGPRNCIGQRIAMLEMKVIISALIRKYRFLPSEKVHSLTLEIGVVLRSLNNHPVRLTLRTDTTAS